jgi:DNA-binding XRE family transcriptional regulator
LNPPGNARSMVCMNANNRSDKFEAFGARLKFLREQWQQSVRDVCNTLEIDEKTLNALEAGKALPSPEILDMLISHFLLTEDQAQDLRELLEDQRDEEGLAGNIEDILSKQLVMLLPVDNRVVYTDSMQATVNESGVILQFMQQAGNGQNVPISRVGMSRQHAERVVKVIQETLKHHDQGNQKRLPSPDNKQNS